MKQEKYTSVSFIFAFETGKNLLSWGPPLQAATLILVCKIHTLAGFQKVQQVVFKSKYPKLLNEA